jgi:hypothetical protein
MRERSDSVWQLGLALGLAVDAGLLLAGALNGYNLTATNLPRLLTVAVSIAALGWLCLPLAVAAWNAAWAVYLTFRPPAPLVDSRIENLALSSQIQEEQVSDYDPEQEAWKVALSRFFRAGEAAGGFSVRKLSGVVGEPAWAKLTEFYSSDAGNRILRVGPGDQGTVWNWGWEIDYVLQRINAGGLPHPTGPVPVVEIYVIDAARHDTKRQRKTAARVIDAPPARAGE